MDNIKKIGKYKYGERFCLGEGSFGKVYEGFDDSGNRVAIKKIQQKMIATDNYLKQSLKTQIQIMQRLRHRNIVQLIDTVATANSIYLILEFCKDGDLKRYSMNKRFTQDKALQILKQLIQGFSAIVKQGIIHRDLKPANVLVHDGIFKICDFGFAKFFGQLNKMAKTCVGTPIYMSPQVLKQKPYTSKSDIWSLGIMYYELLFGKIPFLGKSEDQIFKVITRGKLVIPTCSEQSYLFIKNTLVIDEEERWDWKAVFEHFGIKQSKQKPAFYQNIANFIKGDKQKTPDKKQNQNHSNSYQRNQNRNKNFQNRDQIRYAVQDQSPDKNIYQPKGKPNKMARNILAQDDKTAPKYIDQVPLKVENNFFEEKVYTPQETERIRWFYNISVKFLLKQPILGRIPSFAEFIYSLTHFTYEQYTKQTNYANLKLMNKMKRIVLEQEKQSLGKLLSQIRHFQTCSNIAAISSVFEFEGKQFLTIEELNIVAELKKINI